MQSSASRWTPEVPTQELRVAEAKSSSKTVVFDTLLQKLQVLLYRMHHGYHWIKWSSKLLNLKLIYSADCAMLIRQCSQLRPQSIATPHHCLSQESWIRKRKILEDSLPFLLLFETYITILSRPYLWLHKARHKVEIFVRLRGAFYLRMTAWSFQLSSLRERKNIPMLPL